MHEETSCVSLEAGASVTRCDRQAIREFSTHPFDSEHGSALLHNETVMDSYGSRLTGYPDARFYATHPS
jgi:hypothetical protein